MGEFKVGDRVRWIRIAKWNLRDTTGTVTRVFKQCGESMCRVEFVFGAVNLSQKQIENVKPWIERTSFLGASSAADPAKKTGGAHPIGQIRQRMNPRPED